jgi:hypothetical protein
LLLALALSASAAAYTSISLPFTGATDFVTGFPFCPNVGGGQPGTLLSIHGLRFHGLPKPDQMVSCEFWKSMADEATPSHEFPSPGTMPASL